MTVDTALLIRAVKLYQSRPDKTWGLCDCISFIVMQDRNLMDALTADRHFFKQDIGSPVFMVISKGYLSIGRMPSLVST